MNLRSALCMVALSLSGCSEVDSGTSGSVVWIVCNGLRADHAETLPTIAELQRQATTYEAAVAPSTDLLPSLASILTGQLPSEHGAHTIRTRRNQRWHYSGGTLGPKAVTIAEVFLERGYDTALFTSDRRVPDDSFGLGQGFEKLELGQNLATELNSRVMRWLDAREEGPFFLLVHYTDTQIPYAPKPGEPRPAQGSPANTLGLIQRIDPPLSLGLAPPAEELALLRTRYAEAAASVDVGLNELLLDLKQRGLFEDSTIVITAENGQSLGEHRLLRSGRAGYEELLHVPLYVKAPRQAAPIRVRERRSLLTLANETLALAGLELSDAEREAFTLHVDETVARAEQWYANTRDFGKEWSDRFDRTSRILYLRNWKLIDSDEVPDELYDLAADPREARNMLDEHPGIVMDMRSRLQALEAPSK